MKKQPYYACFSVKIGTFANRSLSLTKENTLYNKVEYIRLMNMNQTRAKARTFATYVCNCIIINRYNDYAGLENMS